jgi:hypothetical protein
MLLTFHHRTILPTPPGVYPDHIRQAELVMKSLLHTNLPFLIALSSVQRIYTFTFICKVIIRFQVMYQGHSDTE